MAMHTSVGGSHKHSVEQKKPFIQQRFLCYSICVKIKISKLTCGVRSEVVGDWEGTGGMLLEAVTLYFYLDGSCMDVCTV